MKVVWYCFFVALLSIGPSASAQMTVAGVRYDAVTDLRGSRLQLNGAGVRYKAIIRVYTAGLYLSSKAGTPEEVMAMPGPKRIRLSMLRDMDSGELGKLFTRAVEDNAARADMSRLIPGLLRMSQLFSECKKLVSGDNIAIDWLPGTGTVISVSNPRCPQSGEAFKEPEFYNAMLSIWLGRTPADWKLKEALLGGKEPD